uniref:Uncharacterized protein n=1 Tax=viral metagenome TaxID=1070528 RepID=A0A6C0J892_9ZZZZ
MKIDIIKYIFCIYNYYIILGNLNYLYFII